MFKELAPVLRHRAVLMTITSTEDDQIRVNVVPKKLKDDENKALTTPLTVTGAAEELDADLGQTLVDFVGSHLQLKNTLVPAKADMDAAAKAAQAEARAKTKTPPQKETNGTTASKPSEQPVKPAEPVQPPRPKTASLLDMPAEPPREAVVQPETEDEDDILAEIKRMTALRKKRSRKTSPTRPESHIPRKSKQQDLWMEVLVSPPLNYFAASAFDAALAFAASDIFFLVAGETTLFFAGAATFTVAVFLAAIDFFASTALLAAVLAERTYLRFCGATG